MLLDQLFSFCSIRNYPLWFLHLLFQKIKTALVLFNIWNLCAYRYPDGLLVELYSEYNFYALDVFLFLLPDLPMLFLSFYERICVLEIHFFPTVFSPTFIDLYLLSNQLSLIIESNQLDQVFFIFILLLYYQQLLFHLLLFLMYANQ